MGGGKGLRDRKKKEEEAEKGRKRWDGERRVKRGKDYEEGRERVSSRRMR